MEIIDLELIVRNFSDTLEACNAEQRSLSNEVLETFGTFIEEILLDSHITFGSSKTRNIKELSCHGLADLIKHLQPQQHEQHERMISFLARLEGAKEDCLCRLHRTIIMCRDNLQIAVKEMLERNMKIKETTNLMNFLTVTTNIIQSIMSNTDDSYLKGWKEKMKEHRELFSYQDEVINVEEINKRSHEGVEEKPSLRRLLQACIDSLQTKPGEFWEHASITIYNKDNVYQISSGMRKLRFICCMKKGEPFIEEDTSVSERKKHEPSTETTHGSSQNMDTFEQSVIKTFRILEAGSEEQKSVANEVLKSFCTFVEEILLAFHLKIGTSDTINVKELLFKDLADLIYHLQPEHHDKVISYLTRLQEAKKDRLSSLHRTVTMCRDNLQIAENVVLQKKLKEQEKSDLRDFMTMTTNIIQGIKSNAKDSHLKGLVERMKEHRGTFSFQNKEVDVEVINKRNLGKMIIHYIGHEGVEDKPGLRRLLQACIDFLRTEAEGFWKNASITIYDDGDAYSIVSGTRKHQFICWMNNGEPFIKETGSGSEHKKPKSNNKSSQKRQSQSEKGNDNNCSIS